MPSIRFYIKYLDQWWLAVGWMAICFVAYTVMLRNKRIERMVQRAWMFYVMVLLVAVFALLVYPHTGVPQVSGKGSDADDALILVAQNLLSGDKPYTGSTYLGNPLATGVGIVIALLPLIVTGLYPASTAIFMGLIAWLLHRYRDVSWNVLNFWIICCMSTPVFWELQVQGSDVIPMMFLLMMPLAIGQGTTTLPRARGVLAVFLTFLGLTGRLLFVYMIPFYGFFRAAAHKNKVIWYTALFAVAVVGVHLVLFWVHDGNYHPLQIMAWRGKQYGWMYLALAGLVYIVLLVVFYRFAGKGQTFYHQLKWLSVWIAIPFLLLFVAEFIRRDMSFTSYAFNYLVYGMVPLSLVIAMKVEGDPII